MMHDLFIHMREKFQTMFILESVIFLRNKKIGPQFNDNEIEYFL